MRRSETVNIRELVNALFRQQGLLPKLAENRLVNSWEKVVGRSIALKTKKIYISQRVLYVHVESSIMRNELLMVSSELLKRLNQEANATVVDKIVFR